MPILDYTRRTPWQLLAVLCATMPGGAMGQSRSWETSFRGAPFEAVGVSTTYVVVGIGAGRVVGLAAATGDSLWSRNDLGRDLARVFHLIPGTSLGVVLVERDAIVISLDDGTTRFRVSAHEPAVEALGFLGRPDPSALLFVLKAKDANARLLAVDTRTGRLARDAELPFEKEILLLGQPNPGSVVLYGKAGARHGLALVPWLEGLPAWRQPGILDKKPTAGSSPVWRAQHLSELVAAFRNVGRVPPSVEVASGLNPPAANNVLTAGDRMLVYTGAAGLLSLNAASGALDWHLADVAFGPGDAIMRLADTVLVLAAAGHFAGVHASGGRRLWHGQAFNTVGLAALGEGILAAGTGSPAPVPGYAVRLLDPSTGQDRWSTPVHVHYSDLPTILRGVPLIVEHDGVRLAGNEGLTLIDRASGVAAPVARARFPDETPPQRLQALDGGYALVSAQSVAFVDASGHLVHYTSYPPPGESFLSRALRMTFAAAYGAALSAQHQEASRNPMLASVPGSLPSDYFDERFFRASAEADRFAFMLTNRPLADRRGISLVRIDKATGQEMGRAWIEHRNPKYALNPPGDVLFLVKSGQIVALPFASNQEP